MPIFAQMASPKYSIVVPVYNRPEELDKLLESLTQQTFHDFEVLVIEDGSSVRSEHIFAAYAEKMLMRYFFKPNSGPGPSRNFGFQQAAGEYFVVFDSDCQIPPRYLQTVDDFLTHTPLDAWGGPDRGHGEFTALQQAMACTMSSMLTTGGIRGGQPRNFQPRSFNMGIRRSAFLQTGGFRFDRFAEDIEFSLRMKALGLRVGLIPDAFVYHQRRATLGAFFKQVANFGKGRVLVGRVYPGEVKIVHWFPSIFLAGFVCLIPLLLWMHTLGRVVAAAYGLYLLAIAIDAFRHTQSMAVACLSVPSAVVQLCGYGGGFLKEKFKNITSR